jgi:hypothetical protein
MGRCGFAAMKRQILTCIVEPVDLCAALPQSIKNFGSGSSSDHCPYTFYEKIKNLKWFLEIFMFSKDINNYQKVWLRKLYLNLTSNFCG